jgi:hypothetical protein
MAASPCLGEQMNLTASEDASALVLRRDDYRLENVYLRATDAERAEILAMWRDEHVGIDEVSAERSSREAVYLVRNPSGELAGVSNVALIRLKDGRRFYSCSLFLRPRDRVPYLMIRVCNATRDFLRTFRHPVSQPAGMLNVNENRRLMRPGVRRLFARHGYRYWGQTSKGEDVWVTEFGEQSERSPCPSVIQPAAAETQG